MMELVAETFDLAALACANIQYSMPRRALEMVIGVPWHIWAAQGVCALIIAGLAFSPLGLVFRSSRMAMAAAASGFTTMAAAGAGMVIANRFVPESPALLAFVCMGELAILFTGLASASHWIRKGAFRRLGFALSIAACWLVFSALCSAMSLSLEHPEGAVFLACIIFAQYASLAFLVIVPGRYLAEIVDPGPGPGPAASNA